MRQVHETDDVRQEHRFERESREITLSSTYRFGGYRDRGETRPYDGIKGGEDELY